jgi:hypothetical protein
LMIAMNNRRPKTTKVQKEVLLYLLNWPNISLKTIVYEYWHFFLFKHK